MAEVRLHNITKSFGALTVLPDLNLTVPDGSFTVLVGPSGCGKSTLLRIISGLEEPTSGAVMIGGQDVTLDEPSKRGISMVFQSYALYPHMTVAQNIDFGLRLAKMPAAERQSRVAEAARILALEPYLDRKPAQLSGGQRQRVAIGRSIVRQPKVFLFDEPLSNLDAALRTQMRVELAQLHQSLDATMIYVTHDQVEAMTLADQIVVMNAGRIEQVGAPMELYDRPQTVFVAGFIGSPKMNLIPAASIGQPHARTAGIRPEHLVIDPEGRPARALVVETLGADTIVHADVEAIGPMTIRLAGNNRLRTGDVIRVSPQPGQLHLFDEQGQRLPDPETTTLQRNQP
ncbi:ABC transporter ATP-binding protein [Paracoccus sp. (in: a-proteobacteria)]|uniref:ABC transporter ATP-binding protein n=1 Tax=Paracoccus sp. TaxID=267 RepID=UPI00272B65A9|nr:sn-glycerol-3-phosphate ABC transporter ATP-binding protein UgpC [Paracoccus sp. (in: a-proteobacteria)]